MGPNAFWPTPQTRATVALPPACFPGKQAAPHQHVHASIRKYHWSHVRPQCSSIWRGRVKWVHKAAHSSFLGWWVQITKEAAPGRQPFHAAAESFFVRWGLIWSETEIWEAAWNEELRDVVVQNYSLGNWCRLSLLNPHVVGLPIKTILKSKSLARPPPKELRTQAGLHRLNFSEKSGVYTEDCFALPASSSSFKLFKMFQPQCPTEGKHFCVLDNASSCVLPSLSHYLFISSLHHLLALPPPQRPCPPTQAACCFPPLVLCFSTGCLHGSEAFVWELLKFRSHVCNWTFSRVKGIVPSFISKTALGGCADICFVISARERKAFSRSITYQLTACC